MKQPEIVCKRLMEQQYLSSGPSLGRTRGRVYGTTNFVSVGFCPVRLDFWPTLKHCFLVVIVTPDANDDKTNEINQPIDDRTLCMTFSKGYSTSKEVNACPHEHSSIGRDIV
ncbi:hypothetical protein MTR_7g029295 [Medicago truncatula]|uniref:Uncharacterized protein n=1 Tax=Medicago truncatula TaxID=3880 RepID=A0A072U859_MEDTR|nr:hypothetical protein MTR_7g029295 [Medicago truncatula]